MRSLSLLIVLLLHLARPLLALPATTTSSASFSHSASHSRNLSSSHSSRRPSSTTHSPQIISNAHPFHPHPTFTPFAPTPTPTLTLASSHSHAQKPVAIVFEALGGAVALALLLGILRCCYIYKRTPKRDRIAAIVSRHRLERELQELERNNTTIRRPSAMREPAPPYFPPPPTYENQHPSPFVDPVRTGARYTNVASTSPPSVPISPTSTLESVTSERHSAIVHEPRS